MPEYLAYRSQIASVAGGTVPSDTQITAERLANQQQAAADLNAALASGGNVAVAPPLADAALRVLRLAAQGDSLAQLPAAPAGEWMQAWRTGTVRAGVWADRGHRFQRNFLWATDSVGLPWPVVASWSGAETGFSAGTAITDTQLAAALSAAHPGLNVLSLTDIAQVRALVAQWLDSSTLVSGGSAGTGVIQLGHDGLGSPIQHSVPLLRTNQNVSGSVGSDYEAQVQASGNLRLLKITPTAADIAPTAYAASGRLAVALAEAVASLVAPGGGGTAAELVLPTGSWALGFDAHAALVRQGVTRVFDKTQADLRGVDEPGRLYLQMPSPSVQLTIDAAAARWQAAQQLGFSFDPQNPNGNYGSVSTIFDPGVVSTWPADCVWPTPDLRPFFLALTDERGRVLMLAALSALTGTAVTPTCP